MIITRGESIPSGCCFQTKRMKALKTPFRFRITGEAPSNVKGRKNIGSPYRGCAAASSTWNIGHKTNLVRANSTKLPRYLWIDRIVHPVAIASESVNANSTKDIFLDKSIYFHHKFLLKNNFFYYNSMQNVIIHKQYVVVISKQRFYWWFRIENIKSITKTGKEAREEPSETKSYHQKQQKIAMRSASWHWVNLI